MNDVNEKIEQIREKVTNNQGIYFGRIPEKEKAWFLQYAKDEWANDYGIALASLIKGFMPPENTVLIAEIDELKKVVQELYVKVVMLEQNKDSGSGKKEIKMLNGVKVEL